MIKLFPGIFIFLFLLSGMGRGTETFAHLVTTIAIACLSLSLLRTKRKLATPPGFGYLVTFNAILFISILWTENVVGSVIFNLIFLEASFFYFWAYNFFEKGNFRLAGYVLVPTTLYTIFHVFSLITGLDLYFFFSHFYDIQNKTGHFHLGDMLALSGIVFAYLFLDRKRFVYPFFVLAVLFLMSQMFSRSAFLTLGSGVVFFTTYKKGLGRTFLITLMVTSLVAFVALSQDKSVLFQRPYFVQSILGFFERPQGYGMGNFGLVSTNFTTGIAGYSDFSTYTHNIFLEILTGIGVFSLPFFLWFYKNAKIVLVSGVPEVLLPGALFIALTVNFLFDMSYTISGLVWFWFYFLGVVVGGANKRSSSSSP